MRTFRSLPFLQLPALLATAICGLFYPAPALAQPPPTKFEFEVASVKPHGANVPMMIRSRRSGERVAWFGVPLGRLVEYAYDISLQEVTGLQTTPDFYDIEATVPAAATEGDIKVMFQGLLQDRFRMKGHRETREMPVYELIPTSKGSKLKPTSEGSPFLVHGHGIPASAVGIYLETDGRHFAGQDASIQQLIATLSGIVRRPIIDHTGLQGHFDFDVVHGADTVGTANEAADATLLPDIRSAIQDVLGLKLQDAKGPVQILVIEHIEKPSEN